MNKKFSTLVAGLLLTTSFGAFAAANTELGVKQKDFKSGSTYFLTTSADNEAGAAKTQALVVSGAELKMVNWVTDGGTNKITEIEEMTKAEREYAMWTVTATKVSSTSIDYEFTNKATGQKLKVSAAAPGVAFTANGVSQFENWIEVDPTKADQVAKGKLTNEIGVNTVVLKQAYVIGNEGLKLTSVKPFDELTGGKGQVRLMEEITAATRSADNITAVTADIVADDKITTPELKAQKAAIVKVDALLASLNLKRTDVADYDAYAKAIEGLQIPSSAADVDKVGIKALQTASSTALNALLKANNYGWKITEAGVVSGVVSDAAATIGAAATYKKGTIFVATEAFEVLPALMPEAAYTVPAALVKDDEVYVDGFAREFNKGSQDAKDVVAVLGFDGPVAETNVLANADIQIVKRNLLKVNATSGKVENADALAAADFQATTVIMDKKSGKYLVVKPETYEPGVASSSYFKLAWADLDAYTEDDMTLADDYTYSRAKGNLTAAYMFDVKYNMNNDSLTIMPAFIIKKTAATAAADTVGTSYSITENTDINPIDGTGSAYVLSLKQFSASVEMTVVKKDGTPTADSQRAYRINTGATSTGSGWEITSKPSDVYFIQLITGAADRKVDNEKFFTADPSAVGGLVKNSIDKLNCIPFAQWALVKDAGGVVTIKNRATGAVFNDTKTNPFENAQLYKAGGELVSVYGGDTLKLTAVDSKYKTDSTLGYFAHDAKKNEVLKYKLTYFNELDATKNVSYAKDSIMFVDKEGEGMWFQVKPVKDQIAKEFGADAIKDVSKKLTRTQYTMFTKINGKEYNVVYVNTNGKFEISAATSDEVAVKFYIKTLMHADTCWNVLENVVQTAGVGWDKVSVNDNNLELFGEEGTEKRTSMFALTQDDAPKYRRFGETLKSGDGIAKNDTAYVEFFKADEPTRFLFENTRNKVAGNGTGVSKDSLNFLGMYNKADFTVNASIFVDTAYVRNDTIKPLYMLAMDATHVPSSAIPCPVDGSLNCPHHKDQSRAYTTGRYLVALHDSVEGNKSALYQEKVRLAFVPAKHIADTLVINNSIFTGVKDKTANDSLIVKGDNMTAATFAFRLVNDDPADFYIETVAADNETPAYVRIHNGIPVLIDKLEDAALFNVGKTDVRPTDNEGIETTEVSVIAGNGQATIKNAEGKRVVISNILGQTLVNTVITSDNATINVPAGIAVVAVEGEDAVKAIVK